MPYSKYRGILQNQTMTFCSWNLIYASSVHLQRFSINISNMLNNWTKRTTATNDGKYIITWCANNNPKTCSIHKCSGSNNNSPSQQQYDSFVYVDESHCVCQCLLFVWMVTIVDETRRRVSDERGWGASSNTCTWKSQINRSSNLM